MDKYLVCALYKFVRLEDFKDLRQPLFNVMEENQVRGTLLLAYEGINGTIAGPCHGVRNVVDWLNSDERMNFIDVKESYTDVEPFKRTKVKLKKEIVTMGVAGIDPTKSVGTYVEPEDWNELIAAPDVTLIDTRNEYEYEIGTFQNAINPHTESFREFPEYVEEHLDPRKHKKIAMFCTGGIRCEKSTALLKQRGFEEVYHLKGGILKYLEHIPEEKSLWQGECFVFDDRVAVKHGLTKGQYDQCHACRFPIAEEEKQHEKYIQGVSCPRCFDKTSEQQKARYLAREKQMRIAAERGEAHMGHQASKMLYKKTSNHKK